MTNPVSVAWIGVLIAVVLWFLKRRRIAGGLLAFCGAWLWIWMTPLASRIVGATLESPFLREGRIPSVESFPKADAIVLHGGSMGDDSVLGGRGEMWTSADRVWKSACLWKSNKAPMIYVLGGGVRKTTAGLMADFNVPTNALVFADSPRNTEEEARFVAESLKRRADGCRERAEDSKSIPRVLVVTSAWHMRRTLLMYRKYAPGVDVVPVACDFENTFRTIKGFSLAEFLPSDEALAANRVAIHEWVGILGYIILRR